MAEAFKCDRCDQYEDDKPVAGVTFTTPKAMNPEQKARTEYELCAKCLASLQDWADHYKRPQGFTSDGSNT